MKVFERLAEAFAAEETRAVFGVMGSANMHWLDALDKYPIKQYHVRHEAVGMGMADGWARATHTVGVATTTCGPGVTQLASALVTANRAASPVVVFAGEHPTTDDAYNQSFNPALFAAACDGTAFVRVNSPNQVDAEVRKAFYIARTENRPVLLSAPYDTQALSYEWPAPYIPSTTLINSDPILPHPDRLAQAVDIITSSRKPVIVVGRGAKWAGADAAVLKLAERIGALIGTSLMAQTWLADDDFYIGVVGAYSTQTTMDLLAEADCVVAVGASLNFHTLVHGRLIPNARFVHLDTRPSVVMGNGRAADCFVRTDARLGVEALEQLLATRSFESDGFRTAAVKTQLTENWLDPDEFPIAPGTVDPRELCTVLDESLPSNIGLVVGTGSSIAFPHMTFRRPRLTYLAGIFFGCLAQGLPAALGALAASDNKEPLMLLDGDGGIMMQLGDFDTAVRYAMPLLVVVINNRGFGGEFQKMRVDGMNADLAVYDTPDLGALAVACGGRGHVVRSVDELKAGIAEFVAQPGPMMLDVRVARNVLNIPFRRNLARRQQAPALSAEKVAVAH